MNFCWSLPDRFFTTVAKLSEEDRRALKKFKRLAGVRGKILEFAHCDGEEPPFMRRMTSVPDVLMPFTIMDLDEKLRSGEVTVDSLVASYELEDGGKLDDDNREYIPKSPSVLSDSNLIFLTGKGHQILP